MFRLLRNYLRERNEQRRQAILGALRKEGELSGFEISQKAGMGSGKLYPTLWQLEKEGLISSRWNWPYKLPNKPRKRLYKIAEPGP